MNRRKKYFKNKPYAYWKHRNPNMITVRKLRYTYYMLKLGSRKAVKYMKKTGVWFVD